MMKFVLLMLTTLAMCGSLAAQGTDTEAKLKHVAPVAYPSEALKTGLEGSISVSVDVDVTGKVTKAYAAAGPDWVCPDVTREDVVAMRQAAVNAAGTATFTPAIKDGQPVESQMSLNFKFTDPDPQKKSTEGGLGSTGVMLGGTGDGGALSKPANPSTATRDTETISGAVLGGTAQLLPSPAYPAAARAVHAGGTVSVQVVIDTNGTIFWAEAKSGHPLLRNAARLAACKARFSPTRLNGVPVKVSGMLDYNFVP